MLYCITRRKIVFFYQYMIQYMILKGYGCAAIFNYIEVRSDISEYQELEYSDKRKYL